MNFQAHFPQRQIFSSTRDNLIPVATSKPMTRSLFMTAFIISFLCPSLSSASPFYFAFASTGKAEDGISIFENDDLILMNPVESTTVIMCIVFFAAIFELCFEFLKGKQDKFFQTVFSSIVEESMLVGILAMVLIFVSSVGALTASWKSMINNSVFILLLMVVTFAAFATITIFWTLRVLKTYRKFERSRMDIDPLLSPTEQLMKECRDFFRKSLVLHGLTDASFDDILFIDYIQERSADIINNIYDLSWKSWGFLGIFVAGNVIRIRSVVSSEDQLTFGGIAVNISTFIAIMGVFPVGMHVILHTLIRYRLVAMSKKQQHESDINIDTTHLLFFSSPDVTSSVFSAALLLLEWYIAWFFLNLVGLAFDEFGPISVLVVVGALIPPIISMYLLPWTVINITILCTLGKNLDAPLAGMLRDAALHGIEFSLLATHVPGEDLATAMASGHVRIENKDAKKGGSGGAKGGGGQLSLLVSDAALDPLLEGRGVAGERTTSRTIRGNVLMLDDEWDTTEMSLNFRGDPSDDEKDGEKEGGEAKAREKSDSDSSSASDKKGKDSDDDDDNSSDDPLTFAILDRNYLADRDSYHYQSRASRNDRLEKEMKARLDQRQSRTKLDSAAERLSRLDHTRSLNNNSDITTTNISGGRPWDSLRPMYLPDWRHNPITAREEELRERRAALELEKERLSKGGVFEL